MSNDEVTGRWLEELSEEECLSFLRANEVGRIAVIQDGEPFVFPINFRLVEVAGSPLIVVQTRPGNVIDLADETVAFEVDGIDPFHQRGWSVLVQGALRHVASDATLSAVEVDSDSWIAEGRTTWLTIEPRRITGRRLIAATLRWAFHQSAYL